MSGFHIQVKILDIDVYFRGRKLGTLQYSPGYECCYPVLKVHVNVLLNCADEYKDLLSAEVPSFEMVYRSKLGRIRRIISGDFDLEMAVCWVSKNAPGEHARLKLNIVTTSKPGLGPKQLMPERPPLVIRMYDYVPFWFTVHKLFLRVRRSLACSSA